MTVHHRITWAHMTALEHGGHDKFLPSLANDELRFTMASIREAFTDSGHISCCDNCETPIDGDKAATSDVCWDCWLHAKAATATLDRVREALALVNQNGDLIAFRGRVTVALAGQPGAPKFVKGAGICPDISECNRSGCKGCADGPEAPKGQEADPVKECANCGCVTYGHQMLCCDEPKDCGHRQRVEYWRGACQKAEADLAAANARIAQLESGPCGCNAVGRVVTVCDAHRERDAANARADAAETDRDLWKDLWVPYECWKELKGRIAELEALLADKAHVLEKYAEHKDDPCPQHGPDSELERAKRLARKCDAEATAIHAQMTQYRADLAAANARIAELEAEKRMNDTDVANWQAANARIAELEGRLEKEQERATANADMYVAANARADAAERKAAEYLEAQRKEILAWHRACAERDQLAARVKELTERVKLLEWAASEDDVTPGERKVLEACREMQIVERGSTAYVPPDGAAGLGRLLHAELANRAAKAKREAK